MSKARAGLGFSLSFVVVAAAACSSFSADGEAPSGQDAAVEGSVVGDGTSDAAPGPPCDTSRLATDPLHCGACGHSCLGGACSAGTCEPFVFAALATPPVRLALEDTRVVWSDGTSIFHCPKTGCTGSPASTTGSGLGFTDLTAAGSFTFVASGGGNNGNVGRLDGADKYELLGAARGYPFRVATDGTIVVALDSDDTQGGLYFGKASTPGSLARIAPQRLPNEATARNWGYLATNGTHAFAADFGTIHACPLPSCDGGWSVAAGATPFIDSVRGLAASATDLYWTTVGGASVRTCPIALGAGGCGLGAVLATGLPSGATPHDVFLAGGRLYVAAGDALGSCVPESCGATWTTHVAGSGVRGRAAVDATAIYWITFDAAPAVDAGADAGPPPAPTNVRLMKLAK